MFVIYLAAREWIEPWTIDDLIENFPVPVDKGKIKRLQFTFLQKSSTYKNFQLIASQNEQEGFLDLIIPAVKKQYSETGKLSNSAVNKMKKRTKALISLGDMYGLNAGRKNRVTIIAAATICKASVSIDPSSSTKQKKPTKKISIYQNHRYELFKKYCTLSNRVIGLRVQEYIDFLYACAQNIPWITHVEEKYVHYHLKDILYFFSKKGDREPTLTLSNDEYTPAAIKKNTAINQEYEETYSSAQRHLDSNTTPQDPHSLEYSIYQLIRFGYKKEHLLNWTKKSIRGMADSLTFRDKYGTELKQRLNLDRAEVDNDDMVDDEADLYVK